MTRLTSAGEACGCGCACCGAEAKTKEDEILELMTLREAIERRLGELNRV